MHYVYPSLAETWITNSATVSMTLWAYDGHPTKAQGILPHVPITLAEKTVLIEIKVVNA